MCKQKDYTAFITTLDEISSLISNRPALKLIALKPITPEPKAQELSTLIQALDYNTNE